MIRPLKDLFVPTSRTVLILSMCLATATTAATEPTSQPATSTSSGYTTKRTGTVHDFEYFTGGWTIQQHRLKARGVGSSAWDNFPATLCMSPYLGGMITVDELYVPTKGWAGLTLRTFNLAKHQWSIYWINSIDGEMGAPVVGGFDGNRGEFYGEDDDDGRPVKVRFRWNKLDHDHARWEQSFSYDDRTWETNWTADFVRADTAAVCVGGRPKR